jgi:hypothetical protein
VQAESISGLQRFVIPTFIAITAIKICAFLVLAAAGTIKPFVGDNSADHYLPSAKRLLTEGRFNGPDSRVNSMVAPAYPVVLAGLMGLTGEGFRTAAVCFQMGADLATALLLFVLAKRFLRWEVGALAGLFWLLYPPQVAISTWVTAETVFTTLVTWSFLAYHSAYENPSGARFVGAGCLQGITTLFRATTVLLPLALALPLLWKRSFRSAACFLLAYAAMIAPWAIRNQVVLNDRILVSVGFGGAFLQGADERLFTIEGKRQFYPEVHADARRNGVVRPASDHESEIDRWLFQVGWNAYKQRMATRPLSIVPFEAKKFLRLWYATEFGRFRSDLILGLCSLPFVLPGVWQLWKWGRMKSPVAMAGAITIGYFILLYWVVIPINRYMLPVYPILFLAASEWWLRRLGRLAAAHHNFEGLPAELELKRG